jgi:hypothetical protein
MRPGGPETTSDLSVLDLKGNDMRALVLFGLLLALALVAGCTTMTQSSAEVRATYVRVWSYDLRMMSDDWNTLWQVARPSHLTRWQMR